ncbi:hypothetical protein EBB05_30330 (plasmid) [Methylobacterium brachiatum]|nr:hypothetical protein EBB05_30330 [Methylobacterium brachiatum]
MDEPVLLGCRPVKLLLPGRRSTAVTVLHTSDTVFTDQPSAGRKAFLRRCVQTGAEAELATMSAGLGAVLVGRASAAPGVARSATMRMWRSMAEVSGGNSAGTTLQAQP